MNERSQAEIDVAYLAALVDHRATFCVRREKTLLRLEVRIFYDKGIEPRIIESDWVSYVMDTDGESFTGVFRKLKHGGVVNFRNGEANKMLVAVWPYLKNPLRREQAQECFRFHKTQHGRGSIPLDHELKSIRLDVRRKLMALAGRV